jgi:hypothetical protein
VLMTFGAAWASRGHAKQCRTMIAGADIRTSER